MNIPEQPRLRFQGTETTRIEFNAFRAFSHTSESEEPASLELEVIPTVKFLQKPSTKSEEENFFIEYDVRVAREDFFELKLRIVAFFTRLNHAEDARNERLFLANAVAIGFPYVRAFISTLSANWGRGIPTLTLPPLLFEEDSIQIEYLEHPTDSD